MTERVLSLPRLGETMESGKIVEWLKKPGDTFRRGETLAEVETDKTVVELPALSNGTLLEILAEAGSDVTVDMAIARIDDDSAPAENESNDRTGDGAPAGSADPVAGPREETGKSVRIASGGRPPADRQRATPAARALARRDGVDVSLLVGTGRRGRVETADVRAATGLKDSPGKEGAVTPSRAGERIQVSGGALALRRWRARGDKKTRRTEYPVSALLLHGFSADGSSWLPVAPLLAERGIEAMAFDLPSHGETTVESDTFAGMADNVREAMASLSPPPDILIGHSMGALLAADLAASGNLPNLKRLVLIAPAGMGRAVNADLLAALAVADTPESMQLLLREVGGRLPPPPLPVCCQVVDQNRRHPGLPTLAVDLTGPAGQRYSLLSRLERIDVPVSVIMGVNDVMFPWTQVTALPPTVAIHLLDGTGHVPHWDDPDTIVRIIFSES